MLHAGRQDVAILRRVWSTELTNIFDTQIAAGFAGASAQAGYGNLLGSILGRRVGKTASYTRWDARPLTAEQLSYAAEDVAAPARARRRAAAAPRRDAAGWNGRARSAAGSSPRPTSATPRRPGSACRGSASSTRGPARSPASSPPGASGPPRARTGRSARCSPTRRSSSSPSASPSSARGLEQIRGIHPSGIRRRGDGDPRGDRPRPRGADRSRASQARGRSEPGDAPLIALAEALLRARALDAGLAYELIASRSELEQIVAAARRGEPEPDVRTLDGWRRELVGADLRDCSPAGARSPSAPDRRLDAQAGAVTSIPGSSSIDIADAWSNIVRDSASVIGRERLDPAEVDPLQVAVRGRVGDAQLVARRLGGLLVAGIGAAPVQPGLEQPSVLGA